MKPNGRISLVWMEGNQGTSETVRTKTFPDCADKLFFTCVPSSPMDLPSLIQPVSILIEGLVCILGAAIAVRKKEVYGWFIAFTFGAYVVYDFLILVNATIAPEFLALIFLAASISILYAVWHIYNRS